MTTPTRNPEEFIEELWSYANEVPMAEHPWFKGIIEHRWTPEQIVLGEIQHYLRVKTNVIYFGHIIRNAAQADERELLATVMENFLEEAGGAKSHADIMFQFLEEAGLSREAADHAEPSPGTAAGTRQSLHRQFAVYGRPYRIRVQPESARGLSARRDVSLPALK